MVTSSEDRTGQEGAAGKDKRSVGIQIMNVDGKESE